MDKTEKYEKPTVVEHGDVQQLTAKFGGKFSDVAIGGVNTTPAGNSNP